MSACTDEDLKWAKENMQSVQMKGLIARLEAAEASRRAWQQMYWGKTNDKEAEKKCDELDEAWRKSAGK